MFSRVHCFNFYDRLIDAASLGAANAGGLIQHPLFGPGVLPGSPFLNPLHPGMFPWPQPHPLHAVLRQSLGSPDHVTATNNNENSEVSGFIVVCK